MRAPTAPSTRLKLSRAALAGVGLLIAPALAGCSEETPPVRFATTRVRGFAHSGKQPVVGGWVEFMPIDGTVGNLRVAPIDRAGRFDIDGVAVGRNVVGLVHTDLGPPFSAFFSTYLTPVRRHIPAGDVHELDFDLIVEAARVQSDKK